MAKNILCCLLLVILVCGGAFAQSWESAITTGVVGIDYSKAGNEYTIVLHNMTGIAGDPTPANYDVIVWSLELFNLPAPDTIISMPDKWTWTPKGFEAFEIANSQDHYYTPPALAPGESYTFKFTSSSTRPANQGGPANRIPGFICHVAAVDAAQPGSATQQWVSVVPSSIGSPTWFERVTQVPEPGSMLALASGVLGMIGVASRRRR